MHTYLLIHGAMRGAWAVGQLMPLLLKGGGNPIAIDLPGHGNRLEDRGWATMSTYIDDVIQFIRKESLGPDE
jgi:alpha-beta hydrolase superfamily lysophospholipase